VTAWRWIRSALVVRAAELTIGVVFAWAGLAKIGSLAGFAAQIHNFRIVPVAAENLVAMTMPWIEIVLAVTLLLGVRSRDGARTALALLVTFTLAVILAVLRGLDIDCGCFGTSDATRVGWTKVGQNLALIAVALVAAAGPLASAERRAAVGQLETGDART
jgi:uncharacterized membrane protein YphA (DoxX/SURF4 family)